MRLLYGQDAEVAHWVCERIPHLRVRIPYFERGGVLGPSVAIGVLNDRGEMAAGAIFHNYDPFVRGIEVSCAAASRVWARPEIVSNLLRYSFRDAKCLRVGAATPKRSTSTRRFLEHLGFRREGSVKLGFGDDAAIIYGLLETEWSAGPFSPERASSRSRGQRAKL